MYYTVSTSPGVVYESHEYTYDMNSNITSERDFADYGTGQITDRTRKHTYDELNRLVSTEETDNLTGNGTQSSYRYDRAGNRIEAIEDGTRTEYTFNELDQMVRADMSGRKTGYKTYGYDMRGNLITEYDSITDTYTINEYSIQGCLTRTRKVKDREVLSEQTNTYDGNGRRISRTEEGTRTEYYYAEGMLLYTTDGEGTRTSLNIAGTEDNVIAGIRYDDGEKAYFYGKDIKGSTTAITDSEGNVVVYYDYDDWGRTEVKGDRTFYNQICYTGAVYDSLTELYYMNARYYNPETGTFLSQDTYRGEAVEYGTWNLYAYCAGNPVSYVDPSGYSYIEIPFEDWFITLGAKAASYYLTGGAAVVADAVYTGYKVYVVVDSTSMAYKNYKSKTAKKISTTHITNGKTFGGGGKNYDISIKQAARDVLSEVTGSVLVYKKFSTINEYNNRPTSKKIWQRGKTERVEVEDYNNGNGNIHYHEPNGNKWYYNNKKNRFENRNGSEAPKKIQKILNDPQVKKAINKARKYFNERKR